MIEINGITKRYGAKTVVDNISFKVNEGEIMGFLGPNGAGKTTTMNILTGYLSATDGTAKIGGIEILENPKAAKQMIGYLPELPPLYPDMTVKEYLGFVYNLKHCTLNKKRHLEEICEVVKITDVYNRIIKNLSKGYRQRVGISQALVSSPKVLIFDEPTVGLDPNQIIEIRKLIRDLGKSHTIILSTHILPEVQMVCDRILVINKGKLVANEKTEDLPVKTAGISKYMAKISGPKNDILKMLKGGQGIISAEIVSGNDDITAFLIEADPTIDIRKPLFFALAQKGWPLVGLESVSLSLEDIFIELTADKAAKRRMSPVRDLSDKSTFGGQNL